VGDAGERGKGWGLTVLLLCVVATLAVGGLAIVAWSYSRQSRVIALLDVKSNQPAASSITLLKSPLVIDAALQAPGIQQLASVRRQSDPNNWLARRLRVAIPGDGRIFELRFESTPQDMADDVLLLNAIIETFIKSAATGDPQASGVPMEIKVLQPPVGKD
jgi:Tfp pilus assembly protein PilN